MKIKEISVNRALREMKTLDARILKGIRNATFAVSVKNSAVKIGGQTRDELKTSMKSDLSSITDLIKYRDALKSAVIASNAVTSITIGEKTYTIAEAIYAKDAIDSEQVLLRTLTRQLSEAKSQVEFQNAKLENKFETYITGMYGGKDKIDSKELEAAREQYYSVNGHDIIDPLGLDKVIKEKEKAIEDFLDEVDAAITDSNALTTITVEW